MSNDEQKQLKEKMAKDTLEFIKDDKNDISAVATLLVDILNDEVHPLKFARQQIHDYGNTYSYELVIHSGQTELTKRLQNPDTFAALDTRTQKWLKLLAATEISENEGLFSKVATLFSEQEQIPAKKLANVIAIAEEKAKTEKRADISIKKPGQK